MSLSPRELRRLRAIHARAQRQFGFMSRLSKKRLGGARTEAMRKRMIALNLRNLFRHNAQRARGEARYPNYFPENIQGEQLSLFRRRLRGRT